MVVKAWTTQSGDEFADAMLEAGKYDSVVVVIWFLRENDVTLEFDPEGHVTGLHMTWTPWEWLADEYTARYGPEYRSLFMEAAYQAWRRGFIFIEIAGFAAPIPA